MVIREWLVKADNDLLTAAHTLTFGAEYPTDTVCFHAQQKKQTNCIRSHTLSIYPENPDN